MSAPLSFLSPAASAPAPGPLARTTNFRRLTNPFVAVADDLDSLSEEKKSPKKLQGVLYVMLTPWLGLGIFLLGFPVLWFNERRATGRRTPVTQNNSTSTATAGSPTVKGTPAKDAGEVAVQGEVVATSTSGGFCSCCSFCCPRKQTESASTEKGSAVPGPTATEGQSLLHPEQAYDSVVESFEDRHCTYRCCRMVRSCFDGMPELDGTGDTRTYCFRTLGLVMIFTGVDMMLGPTYFLLSTMWFFGFLVAGHLAFCACKFSCLSSLGTMAASYVIHRPAVVAMLVFIFVGISGLSIYYNVPVHAAHGAGR